jgi:hypothetical protein
VTGLGATAKFVRKAAAISTGADGISTSGKAGGKVLPVRGKVIAGVLAGSASTAGVTASDEAKEAPSGTACWIAKIPANWAEFAALPGFGAGVLSDISDMALPTENIGSAMGCNMKRSPFAGQQLLIKFRAKSPAGAQRRV